MIFCSTDPQDDATAEGFQWERVELATEDTQFV